MAMLVMDSIDAKPLHAKCYELLDEIANEHNGDVYATLIHIMSKTFFMHCYAENSRGSGPQQGDHISDWFIKLLEKYPDITSRILDKYIECVIKNPIKEWKSADEKVAIGYAAKYDAELYAKCNKSCTDLLIENIMADDAVTVQIRCLELIERILQHQTQVEWTMFRHDVSTRPREVTLIKETILCLDDKTFSVRRKASQVLALIIRQGSPITTRIITECISFVQYKDVETLPENSERPSALHYAYSFEGFEDLETVVRDMPQIIYDRFLDSSNGLARCSGIALMERLVLTNPRIIYDTNFSSEMASLVVDNLSSVRKATLECLDNLLKTYYNCSILIEAYSRVWPCLLNDEDIGLQKLTLQSFNRNVLMNIQPIEYIDEPRNQLPWRILITTLSLHPRDYLQIRFNLLLQTENIVNAKLVNTIISHLSTSMETEAWTLLILLSSRITNNLDSLITIFNEVSACNMNSNQVLALHLTNYCLGNFSKSALNQLFKRLVSLLSTGSIWMALVSPSILLLSNIHQLSLSEAPQDSPNSENWQMQLLDQVTETILLCIDNFQEEYIRMLSLLSTYSEILVMLPVLPNMDIVKFVFKYLELCRELNESNFDTDNERIMSWMIVVAGRLSIRDNNLAHRVAKIYCQILSRNDRPQLINNTLFGLNDLGKKFPIILENNMKFILIKLKSKYATTRVRTYRCVKDVILAGNIKLKGPILISLLAGLVDESVEVAREADAFFLRYKKLYDKLLFTHCLKECPFDLNDQAFLKGSNRLDGRFKSPLKGAEMSKSRRMIYNHMMSSLDENTLLMYFGQLKLLAEKTKDKSFVQSEGALDVIMDILFIMRRICFCTKNKRQQGGNQGEGDNEDDAAGQDSAQAIAVPETSAGGDAARGTGRGRGGRRKDMGEEALKQLERCLRYVEETHRNLSSVMNPELQLEFDKFCSAMTMRFPNYTDFAQPAEFWKKYKLTTPNRSKRKRRRVAEDIDDVDEGDQSVAGDSDSDSEMPLDRHKQSIGSAIAAKRRTSLDGLATELIFQPIDW